MSGKLDIMSEEQETISLLVASQNNLVQEVRQLEAERDALKDAVKLANKALDAMGEANHEIMAERDALREQVAAGSKKFKSKADEMLARLREEGKAIELSDQEIVAIDKHIGDAMRDFRVESAKKQAQSAADTAKITLASRTKGAQDG